MALFLNNEWIWVQQFYSKIIGYLGYVIEIIVSDALYFFWWSVASPSEWIFDLSGGIVTIYVFIEINKIIYTCHGLIIEQWFDLIWIRNSIIIYGLCYKYYSMWYMIFFLMIYGITKWMNFLSKWWKSYHMYIYSN